MRAGVRFALQARVQVIQAKRWWRENRASAPNLFGQELAAAVSSIKNHPELGRPYDHPQIPGVRRHLLPLTRYHVYYVYVAVKREILVLAVWSAVRGRAPRLRVL